MAVKTRSRKKKKEAIVDDISEVSVPEKDDGVDLDKLAKLKAKMVEKPGRLEFKEVEEKEPQVPERSLEFGVIGSGQCGANLAFTFYSLNYKAVAINTAMQDLKHINMPDENKLHLEYGLGGASKDMTIGHEAAQAYRKQIHSLINDKLSDCHVFVFCTSLGGGSGSGSADTIIDILGEFVKPIVVITVLPMTNEDPQTKDNSLVALSNLSKKVQDKTIHNLVVVDNAKIESIFSDVSQMDFYKVGNTAIVDPLHIFNKYSSQASSIKGLDPTEFSKILIDGEGLSLYGCMPVYDYEEDTAIAEAIITNLDSGLLASGFDLKKTKYVGAMILASSNTWKNIPSSSINYAMSMVQDTAGTPLGVFRGIYEADIEDNVVKVYSFFSGLGLPESRVNELKKEVASQKNLLKTKDKERNLNLKIDTGESETVSAVEKIKQKIQKKKSMFGQFTKGVVDKRK